MVRGSREREETLRRAMRRSSRGVSFRPPFLAFVSGVRIANVIT